MNRLNIKNYLLPAFVFLALLIYGTIYHISSSEFWPITISKTWWTPSAFELSQLQKPLFTLLLATLHLLPLGDVAHLYAAKILFSALGALSLFYYIKNVGLVAKVSLTPYMEAILLCTLLLFSPVILHNFFRIRSDQLTFLFAMLALYNNFKGRTLISLVFYLLIPLISIKGIIMLIPLFFIIVAPCFYRFRTLSTVRKIQLSLIIAACLIWPLAINLSSLTYLYDTYLTSDFPNMYLQEYLQQEFLLITFSFLTCISASLYLHTPFKPKAYTFICISSFLLILLIPQSYPYFIASLAPLVYLPAFALLLSLIFKSNPRIRYTLLLLIALQFGTVLYTSLKHDSPFIRTNTDQIVFIKKASVLMSSYDKLNYIDGMGILPRQRFLNCFVSPDDDNANNSCRLKLESDPLPDVMIITTRFAYLGNEVFSIASKNYTQVLPNFWLHRKYQNVTTDTDLNSTNIPVPMLIFNF